MGVLHGELKVGGEIAQALRLLDLARIARTERHAFLAINEASGIVAKIGASFIGLTSLAWRFGPIVSVLIQSLFYVAKAYQAGIHPDRRKEFSNQQNNPPIVGIHEWHALTARLQSCLSSRLKWNSLPLPIASLHPEFCPLCLQGIQQGIQNSNHSWVDNCNLDAAPPANQGTVESNSPSVHTLSVSP